MDSGNKPHRVTKREKKRQKEKEIVTNESLLSSATLLSQDVLKRFILNCQFLQSEHDLFDLRKNRENMKFAHYTDVWLAWLKYQVLSYEKERFMGLEAPQVEDKMTLRCSPNAGYFWKAFDLFDGIPEAIWKVRFTKKARKKILQWPINWRESLLKRVMEFSIGYIAPRINCKILKEGPCSNMIFFKSDIETGNVNALVVALVDRLPIVRDDLVCQYKFFHYLKVLDFGQSNQELNDSIDNFLTSINNDNDRYIDCSEFPSFENTFVRNDQGWYRPKWFMPIYLSWDESHDIIYNPNTQRWVSTRTPDEDNEIKYHENSLVQKLSEAESCQDFLKILNTIPNFKIKLTDEQQELVGTAGNVLAIGRSGTGKTTCSILRMFSSDLLFKYRSKKGNRKLTPSDLDRSSKLHCVFVTASPVLTNEVKRFYEKLNKHMKDEIKAREEEKKVKDLELEEIKLEPQQSVEHFYEEELEEEEDQAYEGPSSLAFLRDEDFPLFVTVRKLIFMIDATLKRPFFDRTLDGQVIGSNLNFEWHTEHITDLRVNRNVSNQFRKEYSMYEKVEDENDYSDDEDDAEYYYEGANRKAMAYRPVKVKTKWRWHRSRNYEVDFKVFKEKFWPKIKQKTHYSALVIWTEISAYIKGSSDSYIYKGWYLPKTVYASRVSQSQLLSYSEKWVIWDLFMQYERWKCGENAYDFQDIVNYILNQVNSQNYYGCPIHYMMVDEVQDLTPATLALLLEVTQQKLFFSGDTAQTIAKGVGFRFCDLSSLFKTSRLEVPAIRQLTMNFRSHNQILELANSVVALLEALFPYSIDRMAKERSIEDGPKPILIDSGNINHLFALLFGKDSSQTSDGIQFGCNQVIIVRNQEAKDKINPLFKHALCLTVFESKGLEFEDVILYNFFTDSDISKEKWRALANIYRLDTNPKYRPTNFEDLQNHVPKLRHRGYFDTSKYALLCTELKHLYVAVTRPKKRLVIYDDDPENRFFMQEFWKMMDVVRKLEVSSDSFQEIIEDPEIIALAQKSSQEAWKNQGLRMMSHKFYDQAVKCFQASGDRKLELNALAHSKANEATELLSEAESNLIYYVSKFSKTKWREQKRKAFGLFNEAGDIFMELIENDSKGNSMLKRRAARCYASGKKYKIAAQLFEEEELLGQAAEAYLANGEIEKAGDLFNEKNEFIRAIECYSQIRNWEKLLRCVYKHKDSMTVEQLQKYIYKYVPAALEDLMPKLLPAVEKETTYVNKVIEEDKNKIAEVNESDEESDGEQEPEDKTEKKTIFVIGRGEDYENERLKSLEEDKEEENSEAEEYIVKDAEESIEINEEESEENAETSLEESQKILESASNPFLNKSQMSQDSFVLLDNASQSDSFSIISGSEFRLGEALGVGLEDIDPEDEWLQLENRSVVESLASAIKKDGSLMSDYSIIDNVHAAALNLGGRLVSTKADIFIEDESMRKIIEIIGMFSSEVNSYLKSLRSAESLMSSQIMKEDWQLVSLIDLDDMSQELLGVILDTLEDFGMFKMCLVVCNRYHLAERLGRYVNSLGFKYSNLSSIKINEIDKPNFLLSQTQRAVIAYTAVHNVFEMLNPEYLSLKEKFDLKNLGIESLQGLLLLGYWKKTVYIMDKENSLAVTSAFLDWKNYKNIYLMFYEGSDINKASKDGFEWLPFDRPRNNSEVNAAIIALDSVVWNLNAFYSYTIQKKYLYAKSGELPEFPDYFPYNNAFWTHQIKNDDRVNFSIFEECFASIKNIFSLNKQRDILKMWDSLSAFTQIFYALQTSTKTQALLQKFTSDSFQTVLQALSMVIKFLTTNTTTLPADPYYATILFALLSPFGIRQIENKTITQVYPYTTHVIVHKSSSIFKHIKINEITNTYIADIEGQFLLVPIKEVKEAIKKLFVQNIAPIIRVRTKRYTEIALKTENMTAREKDSEIIVCLANIYGELWMYDFLKSHVYGNPYRLMSYVESDMLGNKKYLEYAEAKKKLDGLYEMTDGYEYSIYYLQYTRNSEIKSYERIIHGYEKYMTESYGFSKDDVIRCLLDKSKFLYCHDAKITDIARHAILSHIQIAINLSEKELHDDEIVKYLWMAYELSKVSGHSLYFQEMLNSRYKLILKNEEKAPKISFFHKYALIYLDIDYYYKAGYLEDVSNSICSLFEYQFKDIEILNKLFLFKKAVCSWILSLGVSAFLPKCFEPYLSYFNKEDDKFIIKNIVKGNDENLSAELIKWLFEVLSSICTSSIPIDEKELFLLEMYEIFYLISIHGNTKLLFKEVFQLFSGTQFEHSFRFKPFTENLLNVFEIDSEEKLKEFQEKSENYCNFKEYIRIEHGNIKDNKIAAGELNKWWFDECRTLALRHQLERKLRRLNIRKVRRIKIVKPIEQIYYSVLSHKIAETEDQKPQIMLKAWKNSRNHMKLLYKIQRYQSILLNCFYTVSSAKALDFHYLLSQMTFITNLNEEFQKYIVSGYDDLDEFFEKSIKQIEENKVKLKSWKNVMAPILLVDKNQIQVKRKWNTKWIEKRTKSFKKKRLRDPFKA